MPYVVGIVLSLCVALPFCFHGGWAPYTITVVE